MTNDRTDTIEALLEKCEGNYLWDQGQERRKSTTIAEIYMQTNQKLHYLHNPRRTEGKLLFKVMLHNFRDSLEERPPSNTISF